MAIHDEWVTEPNTPARLAEALARAVFAVGVYVVMLAAAVVVVGATAEWFAAFGLLVPLWWLGERFVPSEASRAR